MTVAALLDLGASWEHLVSVLNTIQAGGYQVRHGRVKKAGIDCMDFDVMLDKEHENHDHDMEYLHGEGHAHDHDHSHEHSHDHGHHHAHEHRGMKEVTEIIDSCQMSDNAAKLAKKIFGVLAEAESRAHAVPLDQVHFHEVGAIDSIVDIISVAVCMDDLGIEDVIVTSMCEGTGTVRCQHGVLPIPVPAVANIMAAHELPVQVTNVQGELITPTGAAIVAAVRTGDKLPDSFVIKKIGLGAGKRNYERPSILRAMIIEEKKEDRDEIYKLESNIDDCTGEELGLVMELLFAAGARDVHYTPVFMKKNRPGYQLNVVCKESDMEKLEDIIFRNTTTIGIRRLKCERSILSREMAEVETTFGRVRIKKCTIGDSVKCYPEYDDVAKISRETGVPYRTVYMEAVKACAE